MAISLVFYCLKPATRPFCKSRNRGVWRWVWGWSKYFLNGDLLRLSFSVRRQLNGFQNLMVKYAFYVYIIYAEQLVKCFQLWLMNSSEDSSVNRENLMKRNFSAYDNPQFKFCFGPEIIEIAIRQCPIGSEGSMCNWKVLQDFYLTRGFQIVSITYLVLLMFLLLV